MTHFAFIMWIMLGPGEQITSDRMRMFLHETQSDCLETARYLSTHGFPRQRCVPVKVSS